MRNSCDQLLLCCHLIDYFVSAYRLLEILGRMEMACPRMFLHVGFDYDEPITMQLLPPMKSLTAITILSWVPISAFVDYVLSCFTVSNYPNLKGVSAEIAVEVQDDVSAVLSRLSVTEPVAADRVNIKYKNDGHDQEALILVQLLSVFNVASRICFRIVRCPGIAIAPSMLACLISGFICTRPPSPPFSQRICLDFVYPPRLPSVRIFASISQYEYVRCDE